MSEKQLSANMESNSNWSPAQFAREMWQIPRADRSIALRYGAAGALTLGAILLTFACWPVTRYNPLLLPFAALIASAWFGGLGPGLGSAIIASAVCLHYLKPATTSDI